MVFKDNREFIDVLRRTGDVISIKKEVDWDMEAGAISRRVCELSGPALLFEKIKDYPEGYRISRALIEEMAVLPDFREPDNLRLGLAPLYTSFSEVWEGVDRIRRVVQEGRHLHYSPARTPVT
jgi:UbiD family decarboxylase